MQESEPEADEVTNVEKTGDAVYQWLCECERRGYTVKRDEITDVLVDSAAWRDGSGRLNNNQWVGEVAVIDLNARFRLDTGLEYHDTAFSKYLCRLPWVVNWKQKGKLNPRMLHTVYPEGDRTKPTKQWTYVVLKRCPEELQRTGKK